MEMRRYLTLGGCLLAAMLLSSCDLDGRDNRVSQDFHYSYELQPGAHLDLTNTNGSVEVSGWDRNSIDVSGTKYAPDQSGLEHIQVKVDARSDMAKVTTELPRGDWFHGSYGVHYRIHVPLHIQLERLQTTNGQISVENLEGGGKVNSTNGKLLLTHLTGDYRVTTTNGAIEWEECSGDERAETTNGSVRGRLKNGSIQARIYEWQCGPALSNRATESQSACHTTNGSVTLALAQYTAIRSRQKRRMGPSICVYLGNQCTAKR